MHLPDISFWLALAFDVHAHHGRAVAWFERATSDACAFCRFTQQGFLTGYRDCKGPRVHVLP